MPPSGNCSRLLCFERAQKKRVWVKVLFYTCCAGVKDDAVDDSKINHKFTAETVVLKDNVDQQ